MYANIHQIRSVGPMILYQDSFGHDQALLAARTLTRCYSWHYIAMILYVFGLRVSICYIYAFHVSMINPITRTLDSLTTFENCVSELATLLIAIF